MKFYNIWKIVTILFVTTYTTESARLRCYRNSITDYVEVPLKKSPNLVNTSHIKLNQELVIVLHGYSTYIDRWNQDILRNLIEAFADTKSYCALNWEKEANAYVGSVTKPLRQHLNLGLLGIDYFPVSLIASKLGDTLGNVLMEMKHRGIQMDAVYLIGHSEGAHLAGQAGRVVKSHGMLIGRITGLDAAKPPIGKPLDKTCAKLVDFIHTDPALYGTNIAKGHVDFWPNYGCSVQPGCKLYTIPLTWNNLCSHLRAMEIMADAVKYPDSLVGRKAASYDDFIQSKDIANPEQYNTIGFKINPNNTGSFYLCTKADSKYGKGAKGTNSASCTCPST